MSLMNIYALPLNLNLIKPQLPGYRKSTGGRRTCTSTWRYNQPILGQENSTGQVTLLLKHMNGKAREEEEERLHIERVVRAC
jgi:hypothetical protein